ncbi:MAG TPA: efflux RND transporter periplasmic adaptor subunit [Steroidobacteraceae bacterium]
MSDAMSATSPRIVKRAKYAATCIAAVLLAGAIVVLVLRGFHARALERATELHAKQYVATTSPRANSEGLPVTLPGTLQGVIESTVYARSSGYVVRWTKDIGASVKKGELLALITAPEIDQQLNQAEAAHAQSAASEALAKSTAVRWQNLREKDAVTQQDLDERLSSYKQAQSDLAAAAANVSRLRSMQGFNSVVAPFDGVVTRRNIDVGDLVDAGNSGTGRALFSVAQVDPLRLYVYVPQAYAHQIKVGDAVTVTLAERVGEQYRGTIARTARAIDTATRTMQVEIRVPNPTGALIAGSYVQVLLPIRGDNTGLVVPTNVLLFRPEGSYVAVVDGQGHVHLRLVKLGTDFGPAVEVLSGLDSSDRIVVNPADSLADGDVVTLAAQPSRG